MDKFILNSGKALAKFRSGINHFLEDKIQDSSTKRILFIVALYIFFLVSFSLVMGMQGFIDNIPFILVFSIILLVLLVWLAIYYESNNHLEINRHDFQMISLKKPQVRFELINLDKTSEENLWRLIRGYCVNEKINFTMGNKSGESANHRILFVLFDELLVGGIKDFSGDRKREFFQLLIDSFLMNNQPLKENTLKTSFSAWKNDQEKINSRNQRKFIRLMLSKE